MARVDLDHGQSRFGEGSFEQAMIGAGGLEDDPDDFESREPFDQGAMAFGVVGDADGLARGIGGDVEKVF
jgi:hypothetical protein